MKFGLALRNTSRLAILLVLASILILLTSIPTLAQLVGATLSGTVTDASGAVLANVDVTINNVSTGVKRNIATDSAGFYSVPNLLPGTYSVTFSVAGFTTVVERELVLTVGEQHTLNRSMQVGQVNQQVEVNVEAATVELSSSSINAVVNGTTVRELPLNGRDWTSLATLQPGVTLIRTQAAAASPTASRAARGFGNELSDNGHRPNENNFRVNGISVLDHENNSPGSVIGGALGVDAISEFSVLTSNYSAEYGRTTGGIINAITKSGTNAIHGSAYWFLRDAKMDARNYFDPSQIPPFHRNNFGASVGGPIIKDRTFFFFDYEGLRQDKSLAFSDFVPSPAARTGNLCSIPSGVTPACTPTTITIDPKVAPFLALYPLPNAGIQGDGDVGIYNTPGLAQFTENYYTARIDHKISEQDTAVLSWFYDNGSFTQPDSFVETINANSVLRQMGSLEETHVFNASFVNTARVGLNRVHAFGNLPLKALTAASQDPSLGSLPGRNAPILTVPGLTQNSAGFGSTSTNNQAYWSYQVYDDAFVTKGSHTIKFGFAFEHMGFNVLNAARQNGSFSFPSLQGFFLNQPTNVSYPVPGFNQPVESRQSLFGIYFQDDWHALPTLTLNFGVRYEPTTLPTEAHNQFQSILDFYQGISVPVHNLWSRNATLRNVAPRVGFSWDPFRNGKTAVRGGFGVFDNLPLNWLYGGPATDSSYPFSYNVTVTGLAAGSFPTGAITATTFDPSKAAERYVEQHPPASYAMNWNINIQRQLNQTTTATVGYVGSHSVHQPNTPTNEDMVLPVQTSAGYLWPFPVGSGHKFNPNVGTIQALTWHGSANYNGFQAELAKKMGNGIQAQGSYTWAKCIDDGSSGQIGNLFTNSLTSISWFDKSSQRGLCDYNIAQNFVVNGIWDLPNPAIGGTVGSLLLGGWEATGIFTAQTGQPFTVLISGDPQGMKGDPDPFPNRLPGCNPINGNYKSQGLAYINVNCFTPPVVPASFADYSTLCQPAAASIAAVIPNTCMNLQGNAGRNQISGPGVMELDFAMIKNTPIRKISESFNVQFRVELFNILNRPNFQMPNDQFYLFNQNGTRISTGGVIDSTTTDAREIQLGLKVIW